jgi:hypothetical protein
VYKVGVSGRLSVRAFCLRICCLACAILMIILSAVVAPPSASAHFTRPFLCSIKEPSGSPSELIGIGMDTADHLWVSESLPGGGGGNPGFSKLYQFEPAYVSCGGLVKSIEVEGFDTPVHVAFGGSTGNFYITGPIRESGSDSAYVEMFDGTGKLVSRWTSQFAEARVAVDNSTDPSDASTGSVYVGHWDDLLGPLGDGVQSGVGRFDAEEKPVPFSGTGPGPLGTRCEKYIENNQIFGTPGECFRPEGLTIDPEGNLYVLNGGKETGTADAVDEFGTDGVFKREITGKETGGISEGRVGNEGFGGKLKGVAVDPVNRHVLVGVDSEPDNETTNTEVSENEGVVDEFDALTGKFLDQITETSPGTHLRRPRDVSVDSHGDLFVLDNTNPGKIEQEHAVDVYGPGRFLPSLTLAEATQRRPTSAEVMGTVDPEGFSLTECEFEYVSESAFKETGFSNLSSGGKVSCVPGAASISVNSASRVHADLSGLVSGRTYRYRLVAASSGALGGTGVSSTLAFTAPHAPRVESTSASNLSSEFVDLRARIDPLGADTNYRFEYVDQASYEPLAQDPYGAGSSVPTVPEEIGSGGPGGSVIASVVQQVSGLTPGTSYHFRAIAESEIEGMVQVTHGPDITFTTLPAVVASLSEGRAYELLTPPGKGSSSDMFALPDLFPEFSNLDVGFPSETGEKFLLETNAAFGSGEHPFPASEKNAYTFSRKDSGWSFSPLASPTLGVQTIHETIFDPADLSVVGILDDSGSAASEGGSRPMTLVGHPGGPYVTLHLDAPVHVEAANSTRIVGASHNFGEVVLESEDHTMCPGAEGQDPKSTTLCEWTGDFESLDNVSNPQLTLVNVGSEGSLLNRCGAVFGQGGGLQGSTHNAISQDGSKMFFTAPDPYLSKAAGCWNGGTVNSPQLYMRLHGQTIQVSAPEAGVNDSTGQHPAVYVGASRSGSKVFFLSETQLSKDDQFHDLELYEYDTENGDLTRISAGELGSPVRELGSTGAHVWTVPAISADGSTVYFTALTQLTNDAPTLVGEDLNVYRYDTNTQETSYVTTVNELDYVSNEVGSWTGLALSGDVALMPLANWYTTPDGRYLVFATGREITGYNTTGTCPLNEAQGSSNGHCDEVYRYDADAAEKHEQSIICVSCNPTGALPVSSALFERSAPVGIADAPLTAMSDDGEYVFFDTADALVPEDGNGTLDVYEWHNGRVSLISSGQDSAPSFFLGASPNGTNVFFGTHARMLPEDTDTNGDLYDARIGGGFPPPGGGTGVCEGDACQNPPPTPIDKTPVSLTFSGPGNVVSQAKAPVKPKKKTKPKKKSKRGKPKAKNRKKARRSIPGRHAKATKGSRR